MFSRKIVLKHRKRTFWTCRFQVASLADLVCPLCVAIPSRHRYFGPFVQEEPSYLPFIPCSTAALDSSTCSAIFLVGPSPSRSLFGEVKFENVIPRPSVFPPHSLHICTISSSSFFVFPDHFIDFCRFHAVHFILLPFSLCHVTFWTATRSKSKMTAFFSKFFGIKVAFYRRIYLRNSFPKCKASEFAHTIDIGFLIGVRNVNICWSFWRCYWIIEYLL